MTDVPREVLKILQLRKKFNSLNNFYLILLTSGYQFLLGICKIQI